MNRSKQITATQPAVVPRDPFAKALARLGGAR